MTPSSPDGCPPVPCMPVHHSPERLRAGSFLVIHLAASIRSDGPLFIEYERHQPEKTLLHEVVRDELEPFLARAKRNGAPVAHFVE
jgi:hypothetical protein